MPCPVCTNPMIGVVTSMLDCSASAEEIAASCGLSVEEVEQHITECCKPAVAPTTLAASDNRLALLADRISACITTAGMSGDIRGQLSALSLGVRAELEFRRRLETQEKDRAIPHGP